MIIDALNLQNPHSVVLPRVEIGKNCRINKVILGHGCRIPAGTVIGEDHNADRARRFRVSDQGVVLVTPDMLGQTTHLSR